MRSEPTEPDEKLLRPLKIQPSVRFGGDGALIQWIERVAPEQPLRHRVFELAAAVAPACRTASSVAICR